MPHGRIQAECYKQPALRIVVANGSLQQCVRLVVSERDNSSLGSSEETKFARLRVEPFPFDRTVEEM